MNPTLGQAHVDTALTQISIAFKLAATMFKAGIAFPRVPVKKQSDKILEMNRSDWLRNEAGIRAAATESRGGGFRISATKTYFADVHAYHVDVPATMIANSDIENIEVQMAEFVMQKLLLERELDWVTKFFAINKWADQGTPNDATGSGASNTWPYFRYWDDHANGNPMKAVRNGRQAVKKTTGFNPNLMFVGEEVHDELAMHPDVMEVIKYTQIGIADVALLARLFRVDRYLIGEAVYDAGLEGATTATYSFAFGKHVLLCYVPAVAGLLTPSAGYIFEWTGFNNMGYDVKMKTIDAPLLEAERIEGEMAYDARQICSELGVFYNGAIS